MQLDFDYDRAENCEIAAYGPLRIKAERDECAGNPWDEWDGNVPLIVNYGRDGLREYDSEAGFSLMRPFSGDAISDAMLRRHLKAIAAACDYTLDYLDSEAREARHYQNESLTGYKRDLLDDALGGMGASDRLEALASIYQAIGWPALCTSSHGYSQGDYAELLFVATPQFRKAMGNSGKHGSAEFWAKDMDNAQKLYSAWAWGDVYSFVIEAPVSFDDDGEPDEWEHLDSCGGFYGDDHEWSGLAEAAKDSADCIIAEQKAKRAETLKTAIRNRIPLHLRADVIAKASQWEQG